MDGGFVLRGDDRIIFQVLGLHIGEIGLGRADQCGRGHEVEDGHGYRFCACDSALMRNRGRHRHRGGHMMSDCIGNVGWIANGDGGHGPHDVADIVGPAKARAAACFRGRKGGYLAVQGLEREAVGLLYRFCEGLIRLAPLGHPHHFDIGIGGFGHWLVTEIGRGIAQQAAGDGGAGRLGRSLRNLVAGFVQLADRSEILVTEIIPHARFARHDVGLAPAVGDYIMRPLG